MLDQLAQLLAPYYLQIKFIHLLAVGAWLFSTSVAYGNYLVPLVRAWQRNPSDEELVRLRNWAMERFDDGAKLEHVAFPIILLTGPMLMLAAGWSPLHGWFALKLVLVVLVFLPIEIVDYYLAHFGGNKEKLRLAGDAEGYEDAMHTHWWFLIFTTPVVVISIPFNLLPRRCEAVLIHEQVQATAGRPGRPTVRQCRNGCETG